MEKNIAICSFLIFPFPVALSVGFPRPLGVFPVCGLLGCSENPYWLFSWIPLVEWTVELWSLSYFLFGEGVPSRCFISDPIS